MNKKPDRRSRRIDRLQNLAIGLLTLSAILLFACLPLFGPLADESLLEMARDRLSQPEDGLAEIAGGEISLAFPVRMVYANDFSRLGTDALTTSGEEFDRAGTYLAEAVGSAQNEEPVSEAVFLDALRGQGLYLDFTAAAIPVELLTELLGVEGPGSGFARVRRVLLCPDASGSAWLYVQDGASQHYRYSTAVSSAALAEFLSGRGGEAADFAFQLGKEYSWLYPYTLILGEPARRVLLNAESLIPGFENVLLQRAGFSTRTENRFTESSGISIVRELSSTLYLNPDGSVDYQGGEAEPDSLCFVPAADPGAPTAYEAASAAQNLAATLLQGLTGDAALYLSDVRGGGGRYQIALDLMADGTPIRFSDGSHAVLVTVEGGSITAYSLRPRSYTLSGEICPLLPPAQAAAVARVWNNAELITAYVDTGAEQVSAAWIAEQ